MIDFVRMFNVEATAWETERKARNMMTRTQRFFGHYSLLSPESFRLTWSLFLLQRQTQRFSRHPFVGAVWPFRTAFFMHENKKNLGLAPSRDPTTTILAPWFSATPCSMYEKKKTSKSLSLPELELFQKFTIPVENGGYSQNGRNLGDSPIARALQGNFSSQRSLPHIAKHFSLGFLSLLRAKKPRTNENLSGSTSPFRHNADYWFHMAKMSDKGLREL